MVAYKVLHKDNILLLDQIHNSLSIIGLSISETYSTYARIFAGCPTTKNNKHGTNNKLNHLGAYTLKCLFKSHICK